MELKEYENETKRTFAYRKEPLPENITDMLHCAIGICTEVSELVEAFQKNDMVNIGEEIADQMWYISNLARFIKSPIDKIFKPSDKVSFLNRETYLKVQVIISGELLDIFKKSIFYNKELDYVEIEFKLVMLLNNLYELSQCLGFYFYRLLDNNISKLRVRFPDKFTSENALERDLDSERKELEK